MQIHAIAGTPRSGSTLLCSILGQHPDVHCSSTSPWARLALAYREAASTDGDLVGMTIRARERGAAGDPIGDTLRDVMRYAVERPYRDVERPIVFDKSRLWPLHLGLFATLWPAGKIVVCVDDVRQIVASVERAHAATATYSRGSDTLADRVAAMCAPGHPVGDGVRAVEEILRRRPSRALFVPHWHLRNEPEVTLKAIGRHVGLAGHTYDLGDVSAPAREVDELVHGKYPHEVSGPLRPYRPYWAEYVSRDIVDLLAEKFPTYVRAFAWQPHTKVEAVA